MRATSRRRFVVLVLAGFAGFALILASLGIYAVISYSVDQRGIRMALGASPGLVRSLILWETMRLAAAGVVIGFAWAHVSTRLAASLLYGVTPTNPLTVAGVVAVVTGVAAFAGYLPAMLAAQVGPATLLRSE